MIARSRKARTTLRTRTSANRARRAARRQLFAGTPQPVSTHLIGRGLDPALAHRFAGAASRAAGVADATTTARIKLRGRVTKTVNVKLFSAARIDSVLTTYRPKSNPAAAAAFMALAA